MEKSAMGTILLDVTPGPGEEFERSFLTRNGHEVMVCHGPHDDQPCPLVKGAEVCDVRPRPRRRVRARPRPRRASRHRRAVPRPRRSRLSYPGGGLGCPGRAVRDVPGRGGGVACRCRVPPSSMASPPRWRLATETDVATPGVVTVGVVTGRVECLERLSGRRWLGVRGGRGQGSDRRRTGRLRSRRRARLDREPPRRPPGRSHRDR